MVAPVADVCMCLQGGGGGAWRDPCRQDPQVVHILTSSRVFMKDIKVFMKDIKSINRMGPPHLGVYLCKAENEIGGDQRGITLTGETFLHVSLIMTIYHSLCKRADCWNR